MRVDGLGRTVAGGSGAPRAQARDGAFRLADPAPSSHPQGSAPVRAAPSLDALLALQAAPEQPMERRRRAVARGRRMLDALDAIRIGLLDGRDDRAGLQTLVERLSAPRDETGEPGLDEALDAIELRARVELAKRSR